MDTQMTRIDDVLDNAEMSAAAEAVEPAEPPKKLTLPEIVAKLLAALEESEGEVTTDFEALDALFEDKALGYKQYYLHLESEKQGFLGRAAPFQAMADALKKKARAVEHEQEKLKARLLAGMLETGKTKIQTSLGNISAQPSYSVEIKDEAAFLKTAPEQYIKRSEEPKKALLLADYKARVKRLMAEGATEPAARVASAMLMPAGSDIVTDYFLKGL